VGLACGKRRAVTPSDDSAAGQAREEDGEERPINRFCFSGINAHIVDTERACKSLELHLPGVCCAIGMASFDACGTLAICP
jgi:hypothetical protein